MENYVDKNLGISTMGGHENIYNKFINAFVENNKNLISDISSLLVGYKDEARRLVHSIKGVSLNVGSKKLNDISTLFETAIMENDIEKMQSGFVEFKSVFSNVMNELDQYLKTI